MNILEETIRPLVLLSRLHFGLNSVVTIVVIAVIIFKFALQPFALKLLDAPEKLSALQNFGLSLLASLAAAIMLAALGVFLMGWSSKIRHAVDYDVFVVDDTGQELAFGRASVRYSPFSGTNQHTSVKMQLINGDIELDGNGMIIDNRYLAGTYTEIGKPERRRSGSFLYEISGDGSSWAGQYIAIDPITDDPIVGRARWVRRR
ncbi:MAG: hypothetical protein KDE05_06000 [Parvularculaceae bacterium]|nr:hypothetical protein [Parvularculaceae bacterium]